MPKPSTTWKRVELGIARLLGSKREGSTGDDGADIYTDAYAVQVKSRARLPDWFRDGMENAKKNAKRRGIKPLLVVHQKNHAYVDAYAVIPLRDLLDLIPRKRRG